MSCGKRVTIRIKEKDTFAWSVQSRFQGVGIRRDVYRDMHSPNPLSSSFTSPRMNFKSSRFKSHMPPHYGPHSNFHAPKLDKNPLDRSLDILRKIAEIKTLREEISFMPSRESYHRFSELLLLMPKGLLILYYNLKLKI